MDYQTEKEPSETKNIVIKKFSYDKEYWEKHFPWTKQNL
tara:strand:- start:790 stop:906 length:117 start_codon:yes stop_codon:yes gene_type:complete